MVRGASLAVVLPAVLACAFLASGARGSPPGPDVASVFHVAKSENRNQVHYGVHLDASCAPRGDAPIFAYWRMLERGPLATEPLLEREVGAYGIADEKVVERTEDGGRVVLRLRALPARTIVLQTTRAGDGCSTTATTRIGGVRARLDHVFVQLRWPFGVAHLVLVGRSVADDHLVEETISR